MTNGQKKAILRLEPTTQPGLPVLARLTRTARAMCLDTGRASALTALASVFAAAFVEASRCAVSSGSSHPANARRIAGAPET